MSHPEFHQARIASGAIVKHRYLIKRLLGRGGLGRTYLALDTHRFNEPCVLKEFSPTGARQFDVAKSRELFKREAKILYHLNHAQIPQFMACFEEGERLFLAQEYIEGKPYSVLVRENQQQKRTFRESNIIRWLLDLLPVLQYIHQHNILHRNISPDNIIQPQAKKAPILIDFAVGKLTDTDISSEKSGSNSQSHLSNKSFVGKIGYAPREQITLGICSPSSDLYSLGVTALVLLTGKQPTHLLDRYSLAWNWEQYAQVSSPLQAILHKMTAENPQERYQSATEILKDIERTIINRNTFIYPSSSNSKSQPITGKQLQVETMIISNLKAAPKSPQSANNSANNQVPAKKEETMIISNLKATSSESLPQQDKFLPNSVVSHTETRLIDFPDSKQQSAPKQKSKVTSPSQLLDETRIVQPPQRKDEG